MKNIGLLIASIVLALVVSYFCGALYFRLFPSYGYFGVGGELFYYLIGLPMAFLFFIFFFFTSTSDNNKYLWSGIAAIPAAAFLIFFDIAHLYFHVLFPLLGWLLGYGISKLINRKGV